MNTETVLVQLSGHVSTLRRDFTKHEEDDKKNFKYAHNMLEDLIAKHANERKEEIKDEMGMRTILADIGARLAAIERLVWFAVMGVLGVVGMQIAKIVLG